MRLVAWKQTGVQYVRNRRRFIGICCGKPICHPERSEGSRKSRRFFAALRMTTGPRRFPQQEFIGPSYRFFSCSFARLPAERSAAESAPSANSLVLPTRLKSFPIRAMAAVSLPARRKKTPSAASGLAAADQDVAALQQTDQSTAAPLDVRTTSSR